jgi:hypothetical protein
MCCQEFRPNAYPIDSGTVESAVKQFKARLTGPRMHWLHPAAERMFVLRVAVLDHSFDRLWAAPILECTRSDRLT